MSDDTFKQEGVPVEGDTVAANPIVAMNSEEGPEQPVEQEAAAASEPQPTQQETEQFRRFKTMRQNAERIERERDEALRRLQEYEQRFAKPAPEPEPQYEPLDIKDDEILEGKHLKKTQAQTQDRIRRLEKQLEEYQRRSSETTAEARIRSQYNDFDSVVTLENMKVLSDAFPEIARSVNASPDLYDKAVAAYTMIKKFGIYEEQPFMADKEKALANSVKPKPLASISPQKGDTPLSRANAFANGLTPELKKSLYAEMRACSKKSN